MIDRIWIVIIGFIAALVISLLIEDSRDWIGEQISYLISFEWLSDIWEFITGMFENIGEFSVGGMAFGLCSVVLIFALRKYMLNPFLIHMGSVSAVFWGAVTYIGCGLIGYLIGKKLFDD